MALLYFHSDLYLFRVDISNFDATFLCLTYDYTKETYEYLQLYYFNLLLIGKPKRP